MQRSTTCMALLAFSTLLGCGHEKNREPAMTPASGTQQQNQYRAPEENWQEPSMSEQPSGSRQSPGTESMGTQPSGPTGMQEGSDMQQGAGTQGSEMQSPGMQGMGQGNMEGMASSGQSGMASPMHQQAVRLAQARCRREARCNQIGASSKYSSQQECETTLLADNERQLSACPGNMNQSNLDKCSSTIESTSCDKTMDRLSEYKECRTDTLCPR